VVGVTPAEVGEGIGRTGVGQAAAGFQVGQQHRAARVEDLGGLRHEVDAAEDDHLGVGAGGTAGELEGVTDEIGAVLDGVVLVVVGQDDGVALGLERSDRSGELSTGRAGLRAGLGRVGQRLREDQPLPLLMHDDPTLGSGRYWLS
jgi:hypothetical protein